MADDIEPRCAICGWPLAETVEQGCVRGNCSQRPWPDRFYDPERADREYRQPVSDKQLPLPAIDIENRKLRADLATLRQERDTQIARADAADAARRGLQTEIAERTAFFESQIAAWTADGADRFGAIQADHRSRVAELKHLAAVLAAGQPPTQEGR